MKVLFLHYPSEARDAKAARLAKSGVQVIVEEPRWPQFYEAAKRERPVAIVIDFSRAPRHAVETADYISKAKHTRDLELFAIHVFDEKREELKERVPKIHALSERELGSHMAEKLPQWTAERAASEQAAREERLQRAEEKKAAAAASRARARERRLAEQSGAPGDVRPSQSAREVPRPAEKKVPAAKPAKPAKPVKAPRKPAVKRPARPAKKKVRKPVRKPKAKKSPPKKKLKKALRRKGRR